LSNDVYERPCQINGWPLESEGGMIDSDPSNPTVGDCNYITRYNGQNSTVEPEEKIESACLVQYKTGNETMWISQKEFLARVEGESFSQNDCLYEDESKGSCFVNIIKGAEQANYSLIEPQKNYLNSMIKEGESKTLSLSNLILMEVSKGIPPGTTFNCRFRVRFSNCSDCYSDSSHYNDDYLDYEYAGPKPFKLINFQFTVIN
ncbi:MAG: hypothetical protein ACOCUH_01565, partial [Bacteriovoracia bacterium]